MRGDEAADIPSVLTCTRTDRRSQNANIQWLTCSRLDLASGPGHNLPSFSPERLDCRLHLDPDKSPSYSPSAAPPTTPSSWASSPGYAPGNMHFCPACSDLQLHLPAPTCICILHAWICTDPQSTSPCRHHWPPVHISLAPLTSHSPAHSHNSGFATVVSRDTPGTWPTARQIPPCRSRVPTSCCPVQVLQWHGINNIALHCIIVSSPLLTASTTCSRRNAGPGIRTGWTAFEHAVQLSWPGPDIRI